MKYSGDTFPIPLNDAGLNFSTNIDEIPTTMLVSPSRNINIHRGGVEPRGGTSIITGFPVVSAPRGRGGFQYRKYDSTTFNMFATDNGVIWSNATTQLKSSLSTTTFYYFCNFRNTLVISNGFDRPQTWDGVAAGTSNLTNIPADWSGTNFPAQILVRNNEKARRLVAIGFQGNLSKETIYISPQSATPDFTDATTRLLPVDIGDGYGPVGGIEYGNRLLIMGRTKTFLVDDSDATDTNWGIQNTQIQYGAAHWRLICKADNMVICMQANGFIYGILTTNAYGNYYTVPLMLDPVLPTNNSYMYQYIQDNVDLSYINDFHMTFDQTLRTVKIFVVRQGQTKVDTSINYHIDMKRWTIHDNQDFNSGYTASCSFPVEVTAGNFKTYTMDYNGNMWQLEQASKTDNGNAYYSGFRIPSTNLDDPRNEKYLRRLFGITTPKGNYNLTVQTWKNGAAQGISTMSLSGTGSVYGTGLYGTATYADQSIINAKVDLRFRAKRFQCEISNNVAGQDYFFSKLLIDNEPLEARPE